MIVRSLKESWIGGSVCVCVHAITLNSIYYLLNLIIMLGEEVTSPLTIYKTKCINILCSNGVS